MARAVDAVPAGGATGDVPDAPRDAAIRMNSAVSQAEGLFAEDEGRAGSVTGLGAICAATWEAEGWSTLGFAAKRAPTGRGVHAGSKASADGFWVGATEEDAVPDAKCEPALTMRTRDSPAV